jgi:hypothetical protein
MGSDRPGALLFNLSTRNRISRMKVRTDHIAPKAITCIRRRCRNEGK